MHLKNFSLITKGDNVTLSPAYDLLNSIIAMKTVVREKLDEIALPLAGKKSKFKKEHFFEYYARDKLCLEETTIVAEQQNMFDKRKVLEEWVKDSFLTDEMKEKYLELMASRYQRLT